MRLPITLALLAMSALPVSAQSQAGIDAWNAELQNVWTRLRPHLERELADEARLRLQGEIYRSGETRVTIRQLRGIRFAIQNAPGVAALGPDRLDLAVPVSGRWELEVEADIRVRARVLFFTPTIDLPRVRVRIFNVRLTAHAGIDSSDPTRPRFTQVDTPRVEFRLELRAANPSPMTVDPSPVVPVDPVASGPPAAGCRWIPVHA